MQLPMSDSAAAGYRRISSSMRRVIEERWDLYVSSPLKQRMYAALASVNGSPIPMDLDWTLSEGSSAFTSLRYLHEVADLKTKFLLGDFLQILRDVIIEIRPQWASMTHGPMTPVPGFGDPI
jgi:hypothetical protein